MMQGGLPSFTGNAPRGTRSVNNEDGDDNQDEDPENIIVQLPKAKGSSNDSPQVNQTRLPTATMSSFNQPRPVASGLPHSNQRVRCSWV
jgi:hypothetical protein